MKAIGLPIGILLLLTQAQEPPGGKAIHLAEITCKTFVEEMRPEEHRIIIAWLQGYYLPEHDPPVIDVDKLSSDSAKLREHCLNNPEDDLITAAEAVFGK
jgi:acid stress chaperone HdeB